MSLPAPSSGLGGPGRGRPFREVSVKDWLGLIVLVAGLGVIFGLESIMVWVLERRAKKAEEVPVKRPFMREGASSAMTGRSRTSSKGRYEAPAIDVGSYGTSTRPWKSIGFKKNIKSTRDRGR